MTESKPGRRIRFLADFDYWPTPQSVIAYKANTVHFVRLECAEQAFASGKAEPVIASGPPAGLKQTLVRIGRSGRRGQKKNDTDRRPQASVDVPKAD